MNELFRDAAKAGKELVDIVNNMFKDKSKGVMRYYTLRQIIRPYFYFDIWNDVRLGIRNLWRWFPIIWRDRNFDHAFLLSIIIHKLKYMEKSSKYWCTKNAPRNRKQMAIVRHCLYRVKQDEYNSINEAFGRGKWVVSSFKLVGAQQRADMQLAAKIIERHLMGWWS